MKRDELGGGGKEEKRLLQYSIVLVISFNSAQRREGKPEGAILYIRPAILYISFIYKLIYNIAGLIYNITGGASSEEEAWGL